MKSVVYYTNWAIYGRKHFVPDLPADQLTHVLYAFADIDISDGRVVLTDKWSDTDQHFTGDSWNDSGNNLYGNLKQLFLLKKKNPYLKVLLSIGGYTYSPKFAPVASTSVKRGNFAQSAVELMRDLGLDGLDIDWEYPADANQAQDYVALLRETHAAMDVYAKQFPEKPHFELTIAAPCGPENYSKMLIKDMDHYLDFWNLMAYDFSGASWSTVAGHQANIYTGQFSADAAVKAYMHAGVPASKLVLGMPLYGREFANTAGLNRAFQGIGTTGSWEAGVFDYKALPQPGAVEYVDEDAIAAYSYDSNKHTLVTYDNVTSARMKAKYIKEHGLGGAMWWESSGDYSAGHEKSIIRNVVEVFGGHNALDKSKNWQRYPDSVYDNIKY
ncbi:glycoside hydrolase superfamily [Lipomyces arxii]|uniref:glycoside hydrolase superfamily n=1 Tax=Lipomyces arxii TaxID=56418 RepID=UPI0034CFCD93